MTFRHGKKDRPGAGAACRQRAVADTTTLATTTHTAEPPCRRARSSGTDNALSRYRAASPLASYQPRYLSTSAKALDAASQVPDFGKYTKSTSQDSSRAFSYFMVGSMGLVTAAGAKSTVTDFLTNMSASSDVLALAKVEVDLSTIPEGKNVIIKVRFRSLDDRPSCNGLTSRSFRSGVASRCSSVTVRLARSRRPTRSTSRRCVTRRRTRTASRSPSGSSCSVRCLWLYS